MYYRETQDLALRTGVSEEIRKYFVRQRQFSAKWLMIATWSNVARYDRFRTSPGLRRVCLNITHITRKYLLQDVNEFLKFYCHLRSSMMHKLLHAFVHVLNVTLNLVKIDKVEVKFANN